jgi:DNA-binding transcriptional LysR family regulator
VEVTLTESADDAELLRQVERGELDLTFADLPLIEGPFESLELLRDPYVLVVSADSELLAVPPLRDLAALDLIGHRQCRSLIQLEAALPRPLRFVFRSDHNQTVQGLVAAGVGAALVPRLTMDPQNEATRLLDVPKLPPRLIAIAWHRDRHRTPAARAFVETARAICAELQPETLAA